MVTALNCMNRFGRGRELENERMEVGRNWQCGKSWPRPVSIRIVEEVDRTKARLEGCGVGGARRNKVFVAAATRPRGLVDREAHLTLDDDPPLRAVAVLRDRRILSGLEQGRGTGPPLEQPQRYAVQRRLGLRQLSDELRESGHGWGNGLGGLKVAIHAASEAEDLRATAYSAWLRPCIFITPSRSRRHSQPQSNFAATIRVIASGNRKSAALPRSSSTAVTVTGRPPSPLGPTHSGAPVRRGLARSIASSEGAMR